MAVDTSITSARILLVDDHYLLAQTLSQALELMGFDRVRLADDLTLAGVLSAVQEQVPDVVLLDLCLGPGTTSIPMISQLVATGTRVMMLTASQDPIELAECIEAGAVGIFDKCQPFEELVEFIHDACTGQSALGPEAREALVAALRSRRHEGERLPFASLTAKEREVLALMVEGEHADAIATELFVSIATVRSHIRAILRKLGVNSQLAAVVLAQRDRWSPHRA